MTTFLATKHLDLRKSGVHACSVMSDSLRPQVAPQSLLSMGFPRQEYWSGMPFPSPGDLPKPVCPESPALAGRLFTTELPGKPKKSGGTSEVHSKVLSSFFKEQVNQGG